MPRKGGYQHSISVSKATGDRIAAAARTRGCSMAALIEDACADVLEQPAAPVERR